MTVKKERNRVAMQENEYEGVCRTIGNKKSNKLLKNKQGNTQGHLCMINVMSATEETAKATQVDSPL